MALLDRFRAQPRQAHTDPAVRLAFVQEVPITERELLAEIAREDEDARVRRAAVAKLMDPDALSAVALTDADHSVRDAARTMLRDMALDAFEGVAEADSLAAVQAPGSSADVQTLAPLGKTTPPPPVEKPAVRSEDAPEAVVDAARDGEERSEQETVAEADRTRAAAEAMRRSEEARAEAAAAAEAERRRLEEATDDKRRRDAERRQGRL